MKNETPLSEYAVWALLDELDSGNRSPELIETVAYRFAQCCSNRKHGPRKVVVITGSGFWARGDSVAEACKAVRKLGAKAADTAFGYVVLNDAEPYVDGAGRMCSAATSVQIALGQVKL